MGFLFVLLVVQIHHVLLVVLLAILLQLSLVLVLYDFKHLILPGDYLNALLIGSFITGIARALILFHMSWFHAILFAVGGAILVGLPLFLLWLVSKGRWIGFGDVRLTFGMGALLGISVGFSALVFSFWIGAAVMLLVLLVQKLWKGRLDMKSMIPFGPFLLFGMWLVIFLPIDLQTIYSLIGTLLW
jgi:prepilin signal peptidase PulO-like enzyme (type II secretory pathway)